jgi:hypothetical protein
MARQRNLAARAGRWSASHRETPSWEGSSSSLRQLLGGAAGINYQREADLGTGESGRADNVIAAGFSEQILTPATPLRRERAGPPC